MKDEPETIPEIISDLFIGDISMYSSEISPMIFMYFNSLEISPMRSMHSSEI